MRQKYVVKKILIVALIGSYVSVAHAFVPSAGLGAITPGESHAAITKDAMQQVYDDLGITKISTSIKKARQTILDANASVDKAPYAKSTARHCDAENLEGCNKVIVDALENVVSQTKAENVESARKELGRALHTLQDFYSHSNWVELGNGSIHPVIGRPGTISNIASADENTCIQAPTGQVCFKGNLTTGMLTSGYFSGQDRVITPGKCRHGGAFDHSPGLGGINKDMSKCLGTDVHDLVDSPHNDNHPGAATLAAIASYRVFNDLKEKLTDREFKNLLGIGPTLAFAIDTTGSMGSVIAGVRATSINIVNSRLGTEQEPSKYVLTPFNDPSVGPTTVTSDANVFKAALNSLPASGGGDCPEYSMRGAFSALSASDDGGELYLFTDASAKDASMSGSVYSLAAEKQSKIFLSLFGNCSPYDPAYFYLANNTGGQVFILDRSEAGAIAEFADLISRSDAVDILSIGDALNVEPKTYTFPVESGMSSLTISLSVTGSASASVLRPDGTSVQSGDPGVTRIPVSSVLIYAINSPQVGEWKVATEGTGDFSLLVNGQSDLSMDAFRFVQEDGRPGHRGAFPITGLPKGGETLYAYADFNGEVRNVVFEFRRRNGELLSNFTLENTDPVETSIQTGQVIVPNSTFFAYAVGEDSNGKKFQRLLPSAFIPQEISIVAPMPIDLPRGETTRYSFKVTNEGMTDSFKFIALDDRSFVKAVTPSVISLATGASTIVHVDVMPPAATLPGTTDTLTFTAESAIRPDVRNYAVLTSQVITPPLLGDVNRDGEVNCDDLGLLKASFGERAGQPAFNPAVDLDSNGIVDARDLAIITRQISASMVCK